MDNRQRVIDRARAVAASYEQMCATTNFDDRDAMAESVDSGMKRLIAALEEMDKPAVRPEVAAVAEKLLVEYDDVWKELAKS